MNATQYLRAQKKRRPATTDRVITRTRLAYTSVSTPRKPKEVS